MNFISVAFLIFQLELPDGHRDTYTPAYTDTQKKRDSAFLQSLQK